MISIYKDGNCINFKSWKFPAGEVGVQIEPELLTNASRYDILVKKPTSDDLMLLWNVFDIFRTAKVPKENIDVTMNYVPYGRQDRATKPGESFALKVFATMFQEFAYCNRLMISDPHSKVTVDNLMSYGYELVVYHQEDIVKTLPAFDNVIGPDAGSAAKLTDVVLSGLKPNVVQLSKSRVGRDVVYDDYAYDTIHGSAIVIDDICDGGATFVSLGEMLKRTQPNMNSLCLYITHGIFSNDEKFEQLKEIYDTVYVWNNISKDKEESDFLVVL